MDWSVAQCSPVEQVRVEVLPRRRERFREAVQLCRVEEADLPEGKITWYRMSRDFVAKCCAKHHGKFWVEQEKL